MTSKPTKRLARLIAEKPLPAPRYWYLSFSGISSFQGAAFIRAMSRKSAIARAKALKITPAGAEDTLCLPIARKDLWRVPVDMRNRLLSEAETRSLGGKRPGE